MWVWVDLAVAPNVNLAPSAHSEAARLAFETEKFKLEEILEDSPWKVLDGPC